MKRQCVASSDSVSHQATDIFQHWADTFTPLEQWQTPFPPTQNHYPWWWRHWRSATGRQLTLSRYRDPPTVGRNGLLEEQTWVGKKRKFDYGAHTSCIIAHTYTSLNLPTAKSAWTGGISPNCSFHLPRLHIWWEGNHTALRTANNVISRRNGSRISFWRNLRIYVRVGYRINEPSRKCKIVKIGYENCGNLPDTNRFFSVLEKMGA